MNEYNRSLNLLPSRVIAVVPEYARLGIGVTGAVFLSQAIYWTKHCKEEWFFKTIADWEEETCLTRRQQETVRRKLVALGILEEKLCGLPARLYFRLDPERIVELLANGGEDPSLAESAKQGILAAKSGEKSHESMAKRAAPACEKEPSQFGGKRQTQDSKEEITAETTTEITQNTARSSETLDGAEAPHRAVCEGSPSDAREDASPAGQPCANVRRNAKPPMTRIPTADVLAVFAHWSYVMGHKHARIDARRAKRIQERLRDGYTVAELCAAVDGCKKSPHHMGENDRATVYDDIELICRSATHVDKFIRLATSPDLVGVSSAGRRTHAAMERWLAEDRGDATH